MTAPIADTFYPVAIPENSPQARFEQASYPYKDKVKKLITIIATSMLISGAANTGLAEQFIVTLEHPLLASDRALRASLRLV